MSVHRQGVDSYLRYSERTMLNEARRGLRHHPREVVALLERLGRERKGRRQERRRAALRDGSAVL